MKTAKLNLFRPIGVALFAKGFRICGRAGSLNLFLPLRRTRPQA